MFCGRRAPQQAVAPRCGVPRARARGVLARWRRDARRRRAEKRLCEEGGLRVGCAGATGAASGAPVAPGVAMMAQGVPLRGPLAEPATQGATVRGAPVADAVPALGMPVSGSSRGGGGGFRDTDVAVTVAAAEPLPASDPLAAPAPVLPFARPGARLVDGASAARARAPCVPPASSCCCGCSLQAGVQAIAFVFFAVGSWTALQAAMDGPTAGMPEWTHTFSLVHAFLRTAVAIVGMVGGFRGKLAWLRAFMWGQVASMGVAYAVTVLGMAHARGVCVEEALSHEREHGPRPWLLPPPPPPEARGGAYRWGGSGGDIDADGAGGGDQFDVGACVTYMNASGVANLALTTASLGYCIWITWSLLHRASPGGDLHDQLFDAMRQAHNSRLAGFGALGARASSAGGGGGWGVTVFGPRSGSRGRASAPIPMTTAVVGTGLSTMAAMEMSRRGSLEGSGDGGAGGPGGGAEVAAGSSGGGDGADGGAECSVVSIGDAPADGVPLALPPTDPRG